MQNNKSFKSGFVSLIGRPNVGKSTLLNNLVGEKVAIVSNKPQTTRNKIMAILTKDNFQIVFMDTPGIHAPKTKLGEYMVKASTQTFGESDILLFMVEPAEKISKGDLAIIERLKTTEANVFLVINKIDKIEKEKLLAIIDSYKNLYNFKEVVPVSAIKGENTDSLVKTIEKYLEEGPKFFPDDSITDQPERQIVSEMIREKALVLLDEEIPHGIAVEIMSMKKRADKDIVDIEANVYCERESHKGMIIGKGGAVLKTMGTRARLDIERFLGFKVNLQIWVKVKKDWRDSDFLMREFGFSNK